MEGERNEDKLMSKNEIENKLPIYKLKTTNDVINSGENNNHSLIPVDSGQQDISDKSNN